MILMKREKEENQSISAENHPIGKNTRERTFPRIPCQDLHCLTAASQATFVDPFSLALHSSRFFRRVYSSSLPIFDHLILNTTGCRSMGTIRRAANTSRR